MGAISTDPGDDPKKKSKDAGDDQGISKSKSKSRDVEDEGAAEESPQEALEAMILEPTQDSINRVIDGVISNALDVVCSFVKVLQCKETEMYVMPEGEDENEEENEGVDLATTIRGLPFTHVGKIKFIAICAIILVLSIITRTFLIHSAASTSKIRAMSMM